MKSILRHALIAGAALALLAAGPASAASPPAPPATTVPNPLPITPGACTIAQTVVTTSTTSAALVAANASRKAIRFMVTGTSNVTIAPGTSAATVGAGMVYAAAPTTNGQGGADTFADPAMATNAFQVISPAASSVTVWECS